MAALTLDFELHPRQSLAFTSKAQEILFGGATRGGKSYFFKAFALTWCHRVPGLQALIIRERLHLREHPLPPIQLVAQVLV